MITSAPPPCFHLCSGKCDISSSPGNMESEAGSTAPPWVGQLNVLKQVVFLSCSS